MRFYTVILPIVLVGFSTLMGVEALKCACNGGLSNTEHACNQSGHTFGITGCGVAGCCVDPREIESFVNVCNSLGYSFRECYDCPDC